MVKRRYFIQKQFQGSLPMKHFDGSDGDNNEDEFQRVPEFMHASAYLDRRQQQILQSEEEIIGFQHAIGNLMLDIAHLLAATPSAGNQAILQRSFGELEGLANAVAQTTAAAPSGADHEATRGAEVDLPGIQAAIESRASGPSGTASNNADDKTRKKAATAKELPSLDVAPVAKAEADKNAPKTADTNTVGDTKQADDTSSDIKPTGTDKPLSNLDRFNKLVPEEIRTSDDTAASASSDSPLLPTKPSRRSNVGALKLEHAGAARSEAPDGSRVQGVEPTAQTASTPAKAESTVVAAVRKPLGPGGM
jgi:hypothetical protein